MAWYEHIFNEYYIKFDGHGDTKEEGSYIENLLKIQKGDKILDLCCGYGRHSIELAKRGYTVVGYDLSNILLERAKADAVAARVDVRFIQGDMRFLPFNVEFDKVINIFSSFGYFDKDEDNLQVLKSILNSLKDKGKLLLDQINKYSGKADKIIHQQNEEGHIKFTKDAQFDSDTGIYSGRYTYEILDCQEVKEYTFRIRIYNINELRKLLALAGFNAVEFYGDFQCNIFNNDSPRIIAIATK
jgi:SAM-dependent methyltransferase